MPTGSAANFSSFGDVALKANRLMTETLPQPHDLAKLMHLLMVGSFVVESAVLGLSMQKQTWGSV